VSELLEGHRRLPLAPTLRRGKGAGLNAPIWG
jgi:hypothetical protein